MAEKLKKINRVEKLTDENPEAENTDIQAQAEDVQDDIKMDQTGEKEQSDAKDERKIVDLDAELTKNETYRSGFQAVLHERLRAR